MTYDQDKLDELSSQFDLTEYVSGHYDGKWNNGELWIHCPKHVDKTPSMSINPEKNAFYCFSCKRHGGPINWLRDVEGYSFQQSIKFIADYVGIDLSEAYASETLAFLKKLNRKKEKKIITHQALPQSQYDQYSDELPEEWIEEGISSDALRKYEVRIDNKTNRIVYPVYDNSLRLIGVKGRTRVKCWKELGLQKYNNYYKIGGVDFFAGMKQAKESILETGEAIIFEGIKSCMKAFDYGFKNTLAAETNNINIHQVKILISMHVKNVVVAFDKGVDMSQIEKSVAMLRKFVNVYIVRDDFNLLEDKMAPVDAGKDVWIHLYNNKKRL